MAGPATPSWILVVEDNPADVCLLEHAMSHAQVKVELKVIADGEAALKFIEDCDHSAGAAIPDLAVLDLNIPKISGTELLEAIRRSGRLGSVPVAILSSSASPSERSAAELLGAKYITKPTNLKDFLDIGGILREMIG